MKLWTYKIERNPTEPRLNELGQEGWELISVVGEGGGLAYSAFLKREWIPETERPELSLVASH